MPSDLDPGRIEDRLRPPLEVCSQLAAAHPQLEHMAMPMERNQMTLRVDPGSQRRAALHLFTNQEEHGANTGPGEDLEHRRRSFGMGTIIEGQRYAVAI